MIADQVITLHAGRPVARPTIHAVAVGCRARGRRHRNYCDAGADAARHALHFPRPGIRGSGLPSPVLKLAWQRRHTYIFELDIICLAPGSEAGRAAEYSACVWRSFWVGSGGFVLTGRVAMIRFRMQVDRFQARLHAAVKTI